MTLGEFFSTHKKAAVAFSGGADSAYLLWAGTQFGAELTAYIVKSAFQPDFELEDAQRLCAELGVPLRVLPLDILSVPGVRENGPERCYLCKKAIFSAIAEAAAQDGYTLLLDGTNASDDASDRPGMRATKELGVLSPLRLCGITKKELRRLSREAGLFTADKPAYACLATRVPTGKMLTEETLRRVERAESALGALGFSDLRVRTDGIDARLELLPSQIPIAAEKSEELRKIFAEFTEMTIAERQTRD